MKPMADLLYKWPVAAKFGSRIPKEKIYEYGNLSTAVREKFVSEVQRITWAYKLAETTINLPGNRKVPEIQVFQVDSKTGDVANQVLAAVDKAIHYPIIFEITRLNAGRPEVRMTAALKELSSGASKVGAYSTTGWVPAGSERQLFPVALSLENLYLALLSPLTSVTVRPGEEMSEAADRLAIVHKLERDITTLERQLRTEPQFNRKVEMLRTLKTKKQELEQQR